MTAKRLRTSRPSAPETCDASACIDSERATLTYASTWGQTAVVDMLPLHLYNMLSPYSP